jgi:hypothetical protein
MKFWELAAAFRGSPDLLKKVLCRPEWLHPWGAALERWADLVARQERSVLDAPVPHELSRSVASFDQRTWSMGSDGYLRLGPTGEDGEHLLSTLEVHERFGGWVIEDVLEHGSLRVSPTG